MSRKNKAPSAEVSWGYGYVVGENAPNVIIGNVLTLVEILGLSEKQEQPFKDLVRQRIWDCFNEGVNISPERHTEIRELHTKMYAEARKNNVPPRSI